MEGFVAEGPPSLAVLSSSGETCHGGVESRVLEREVRQTAASACSVAPGCAFLPPRGEHGNAVRCICEVNAEGAEGAERVRTLRYSSL